MTYAKPSHAPLGVPLPALSDAPTPAEDIAYLEAMFANWVAHSGDNHPHLRRYERWSGLMARLGVYLAADPELTTNLEGETK